jgi:hypothetical protein
MSRDKIAVTTRFWQGRSQACHGPGPREAQS